VLYQYFVPSHFLWQITKYEICPSMLGGPLITTAWRVLRLRMEETPSRYGGKLRIYWLRSRGQPTRGGSPARGLGVRLTNPRCKNKLVTKMLKKPYRMVWIGLIWLRIGTARGLLWTR
jgi:hypothetical protein